MFLSLACVIGFVLYFLPSIIAKLRKKGNFVPILLTNFFFGWTAVGWVIALIWSTTAEKK